MLCQLQNVLKNNKKKDPVGVFLGIKLASLGILPFMVDLWDAQVSKLFTL